MSEYNRPYPFHVSSEGVVTVARRKPVEPTATFPAAVYKINPPSLYIPEYHLTKFRDEFDVQRKVFGDASNLVDRFVSRFDARGEVSGLMTGLAGAGKTMLSKMIANKVIKELGIPVVMVEQSFEDVPGLKSFLADLGAVLLVFDEFGKKFSESEQNEMLDMFSGAYECKRGCLMIDNSTSNISKFILNRPGRALMHIRYGKVGEDVINDVVDFYNLTETQGDCIRDYVSRNDQVGIDTVLNIVKEMLFDGIDDKEEFSNLIRILNVPSRERIKYKLLAIEAAGKVFPVKGTVMEKIGVCRTGISPMMNFLSDELLQHVVDSANGNDALSDLVSRIELDKEDIDELIDSGSPVTVANSYEWEDEYFNLSRRLYTSDDKLIFSHMDESLPFRAFVEEVFESGVGNSAQDFNNFNRLKAGSL